MNASLAAFGQRLKSLAHRYDLPAFWRWWLGELAPLVPAAPRAALRRRRLRPILAFGRDAVVLWAPRFVDGVLGYGEAARIPLGADAAAAQAGRAAIDALSQRAYGGAVTAAKVVVALPSEQMLRKRLHLPAAVEQELRQALAYDLDRHTPFKPDELYFDAVVAARDARQKTIVVDWAAALRSLVDQATRQAESWGATVVSVTPDALGSAPPPATGLSKLNLLPPELRPDLTWWRRWRVWAPVAALGVAALIGVLLPIWQKRDYAIALTKVAEQARVQADAASALRQQLETMTSDFNFILGRKYAFPSAVDVIDDVTRIIPDDTWLTQFEVKTSLKGKDASRDMLLRGESANAGRLVTLLEESKLFTGAAPRSPTTKIQPGPGEIFDLGAQVRAAAAPPTLQLASTASPESMAVPAAPAPATAAPSPAAVAPSAAPTAAPTAAPAAAPLAAAPAAAANAPPAPGGGAVPPAPVPQPAPPASAPAASKDAANGMRIAPPGTGPGVAPLGPLVPPPPSPRPAGNAS
jgi:general secretion pathway protein L